MSFWKLKDGSAVEKSPDTVRDRKDAVKISEKEFHSFIAAMPRPTDEKPARRAKIDKISNFPQLRAFLKKERGL